MTQRERVLAMLRSAGTRGVLSCDFYAAFLPRAGARIWELRQEGYEISSEREKQFVRYRLENSAGVGAGVPSPQGMGTEEGSARPPGLASCADPGESRLFELPKPPSAYDPYSEAA